MRIWIDILLHEYQNSHVKNRIVIERCERVKVNTNVILKDSLVDLGVIIRDEVGHVVLFAIEIVKGIFSPLIAKLMAIYKVGFLANTNLMFEVDSLNALSIINKVGLSFAPEEVVIDEAKSVLKSTSFYIQFRREDNRVAN